MAATYINDKDRVTFPPDPNPKVPKLVAPPGSWDTHFHVYGPPHVFPYVETRAYTPPAAPVEHYLLINAALGLERGVIVQPAVHGTDTRVTVDAVAKSDGRLRGMIRVDPELTAARVRELHGAGIRALRFPVAREHGNAFDPTLFHKTVAAMAAKSWIVDMQINDDVIHENADMIRKLPLPVVIDTWGRVDPMKGFDQPSFLTLLDLLSESNVYLKIHGANRYLDRGVPFAKLVEMARILIAKAPDKILWGTDWPHSFVFEPRKMPNDGELLDMLLDFAPDAGDRKKILVDNPKALFDFD